MSGIFGVYNCKNAGKVVCDGLQALQHRGQETVGIVTLDGYVFRSQKRAGSASIFKETILQTLTGDRAIGHVKYSSEKVDRTSSHIDPENVEPIFLEYAKGQIAFAQDGELTNARIIRDELTNYGSVFRSTTDAELIIHLVALSHEESTLKRLIEALGRVEGAYSILVLTDSSLIAARDRYGFRPLLLGKLNGSFVLSSESCALETVGAVYIRDVEPGEVIQINQEGLRSYKPYKSINPKFCVMEYLYLSRPDSKVRERTICEVRRDLGKKMALEVRSIDVVIPITPSAISSALGFAEELRLPLTLLIKDEDRSRVVGWRELYDPVGPAIDFDTPGRALKGRNIAVVCQLISEATEERRKIKGLREHGPNEIHLVITSPPVRFPCFYGGLGIHSRAELVAASHDEVEIARYVNSDSISYADRNTVGKVLGDGDLRALCDACLSGNYPVRFPWGMELEQMELFVGKL